VGEGLGQGIGRDEKEPQGHLTTARICVCAQCVWHCPVGFPWNENTDAGVACTMGTATMGIIPNLAGEVGNRFPTYTARRACTLGTAVYNGNR
jgi:hypothetical protein